MLGLRWTDKLRPQKKFQSTIKEAPKLINQIAVFFYKFEAWFLAKFNFPFGASVICLATNKKLGLSI